MVDSLLVKQEDPRAFAEVAGPVIRKKSRRHRFKPVLVVETPKIDLAA